MLISATANTEFYTSDQLIMLISYCTLLSKVLLQSTVESCTARPYITMRYNATLAARSDVRVIAGSYSATTDTA